MWGEGKGISQLGGRGYGIDKWIKKQIFKNVCVGGRNSAT